MSIEQSFSGQRLLRLSQIIAPAGPIPVSKSTWYLGVRTGRFPAPMKLGNRTAVWRESDIAALIKSLMDEDAGL